MMEDDKSENRETVYGVMTEVLDEMLKERDIHIPYLEAPVKESMNSERTIEFFHQLDDLLEIPREYGTKIEYGKTEIEKEEE